jgi:phenylacetic acid degradation operon negative regulatory protein
MASTPARSASDRSSPERDGVDLPRMQSGGSPQHLLLTLLGDYWYGQAAPLPSAALVALLEEFGITGVSARAALSRLARRGLLEVSKTGRRTAYALSARADKVLSEGIRRIIGFGATDVEWSGRWTVAAFSVPEDQRDLRHSLRTRLGWWGFASLYDGLWICPHPRVAQAIAILDDLGIDTGTVFSAEVAPGSPRGGDPILAWDLDALRDRYGRLIERFTPVRERMRLGRVGTAEALVARTSVMDAWRTFPKLDPELPAVLLPPRWPRAAARALFIELYDGLAWLAQQRVVQIVGGFDPASGALVRSHTSEFDG